MIIAFCGKKRSGKDTCGDYLKFYHGFSKYSFASPLKRFVKDTFMMNDDQVSGDKKEEIDERWGISGRRLQQLVGTDLMRKTLPELDEGFNKFIGDNIWVKRFYYHYMSLTVPLDYTITDLRFLNEAEMIKSMGGYIVKIIRPELQDNDNHQSEMEMEKITPDYTIINDSSVSMLSFQVSKIYKEILNGT